jgi:hypothetical protein
MGSRQHLIGRPVLRVLAESDSYMSFYHSLSLVSSCQGVDCSRLTAVSKASPVER